VTLDYAGQRAEAIPQSTPIPNWTIHVSDIRTVKVSNISLVTSKVEIREFFSFSGDIQYIEMQRESDRTQVAYVTFKDTQGADTAVLLTVCLCANDFYLLNQSADAVKKAEDVMSTMLAKGFILGKDAINKAKAFDERHQLSSNASSRVASIDRRMGFSDKISIGTAIVNGKVREMDEKYQLSEMTKSALAAAEQKASSAGSAIMSNSYVSTGASWVSSAFNAIAKAAGDVSSMTREKVEQAEVERNEIIYSERKGNVDEFGMKNLQDASDMGPAIVPVNSHDDHKLEII
ncbi:hypothetical protein V8G54_014450, partial [Vigna mungo]